MILESQLKLFVLIRQTNNISVVNRDIAKIASGVEPCFRSPIYPYYYDANAVPVLYRGTVHLVLQDY